ncbi:MAG: hypothetical protein J6U15_02895 [Lachnospiraceae bacterium]|nr:hypothetical protein [Lachnospiraceae bacterium]
MNLFKRMFAAESFKGQQNYINTQKRYEIIKTVLFFAISASLFIAGYIATGTRKNLLSIVAILGCLPACKSAVNMIMFLRFKSAPSDIVKRIQESVGSLYELYDNVFTTYEKTYVVYHMVFRQNNLCGLAKEGTDISKLTAHIDEKLKVGGHKGITVKLFDKEDKYIERLNSLNQLEPDNDNRPEEVFNTVKAICL